MTTGATLYPFAKPISSFPQVGHAEICDDELIIHEPDGRIAKFALEHFDAEALCGSYWPSESVELLGKSIDERAVDSLFHTVEYALASNDLFLPAILGIGLGEALLLGTFPAFVCVYIIGGYLANARRKMDYLESCKELASDVTRGVASLKKVADALPEKSDQREQIDKFMVAHVKEASAALQKTHRSLTQ